MKILLSCVNKIEARYKVMSLCVKLREVQLLRLRDLSFINCLYFTREREFYASKNYATVEGHP